jgi:hypothetical protein
METLKSANDEFEFSKITLSSPMNLNSGNYFIKYYLGETPLYIQPPKCSIKQGIIKGNKRMYCDLMFTNENDDFLRWLENLENYTQKYIYKNREQWFETELDENDIENSFTPPLKPYRSGKYYILRVSIPAPLGKSNLKIFDEYENPIEIDAIKENDKVMTALEFQGIKCSPRSFQMEIELKQLLVLKQNDIFEKCILKPSLRPPVSLEEPQESFTTVEDNNDVVDESIALVVDTDGNVRSEAKDEIINEIGEHNIEMNISENEGQGHTEVEENTESEESKSIQVEAQNKDELTEIYSSVEDETMEEPEPVEVDFPLEEISDETISLKNRNDIYYNMYRDALKKAKEAKEVALSAYLEAKHIKNTYMLEDMEYESDLEEESITSMGEEVIEE